MNEKEFRDLSPGDVIHNKLTGIPFIVVSNHGRRVTGVQVHDITNYFEWNLMSESNREEVKNNSLFSKLPKTVTPDCWKIKYFDVGDEIVIEGKKLKITKVKKNHFGRYSYYVKDVLILTEEIIEGRLRVPREL